ncbi:hypothetical protein E5676_scaffold228G00110 [Cucumis melo var. makuwa]|uniref:Uncharacterized protein n=1 Tax=Cucumis melo var. makuwa TaxID=1194695 RepID=A0A5A7TI41_CUCMM|nr:hypothetical protein E6C27_scaffold125G001820 [Cucumis melo var. makuwa]TYK20329.1 hypothetical protein E5676_scaffold228G00110 [Cucumis melo var. makuwa]
MNGMSILTTPATNSVTFSARSSTHDSEKNNRKLVPICEYYKKQWHTKDQCSKLHGCPLRGNKCSSNKKQNSRCAYVTETASTSQLTSPTASQNSSSTLKPFLVISRRTIGTAQHSSGLYILDDNTSNSSM